MIKLEFDPSGAFARLDRISEKTVEEVRVAIARLTVRLHQMVVRDKLSGQVLHVKSGRLSRSIADVTTVDGAVVTGTVSTALDYGIGWELGWPGRADKPSLKDAKSKFSLGGGDTFKNGTPKQRSFLRTAFKDLEASGLIGSELEDAVSRASQ